MSVRPAVYPLSTVLMAFVLSAGALALSGSPAQAQDTERLRSVIAEATKLAYEGKYDDAITKYIEAKTIADDPLLDYNIARCYHKKGDCEGARRFYEAVLERGAADPDTLSDAREHENELGVCKTEEVTAVDPVGPTDPDASVTERSDQGMSAMAYGGWGSAIGGGLFIATGLALDISGASLQEDYKDAADRGDQAEYDSLKADIDSRKTTVYVLYGVGVVSAITGGVLLYLDSRTEASTTGASLAPSLGPDGAGAVLTLTF